MLKWISKYLPKRDELLFLKVLALPNASSRGFDSRMTRFTNSMPPELPDTAAMYCITSLEHSVLPAPDSPLNREKGKKKEEERKKKGNVPDDYTLIYPFTLNSSVGLLSQRIYMGRQLMSVPTSVRKEALFSEKGLNFFIRVDGNKHRTDVCLVTVKN